jgi:hypothetical protein
MNSYFCLTHSAPFHTLCRRFLVFHFLVPIASLSNTDSSTFAVVFSSTFVCRVSSCITDEGGLSYGRAFGARKGLRSVNSERWVWRNWGLAHRN